MDETSLQMVEHMEMVPIGKIEEVAKEEIRQRRRASLSRGAHDGHRYHQHRGPSNYDHRQNSYGDEILDQSSYYQERSGPPASGGGRGGRGSRAQQHGSN